MARTHATIRRAETDRRLGFGSCASAPKERKAQATHGWRRLLVVAKEEMALDATLSGDDAASEASEASEAYEASEASKASKASEASEAQRIEASEAQRIEEEEQHMREVDRAMQDAFVERCCTEARGDVQDAGEEFLEETARAYAQAAEA